PPRSRTDCGRGPWREGCVARRSGWRGALLLSRRGGHGVDPGGLAGLVAVGVVLVDHALADGPVQEGVGLVEGGLGGRGVLVVDGREDLLHLGAQRALDGVIPLATDFALLVL